jgi:hypothetical protein
MRTLATKAARAAEFSAQIPQPKTEKQQVNPLRLPRTPNREPSQVIRLCKADVRSSNLLGSTIKLAAGQCFRLARIGATAPRHQL